MSRPSTVDKLPEEIRSEIGRLRGAGHTIDEILAALRELDVATISRSALGRHLQGMEKVGQRLRHSRNVAEALVRQLGDQPASRSAQLNIELLHSAILDLYLAADGDAAETGKEALRGDPVGLMMLAKALDHLTRSSKADVDFVRQVEERATARVRKEAAAAVEQQVKAKGLTAETADAIRRAIFGVGRQAPPA